MTVVRITIAYVKRKAKAWLTSYPCRFCKFALRIVLNGVLNGLGVPVTSSGDYDLRQSQQAIANAMPDIVAEKFGRVVAFLAGLLPNGFLKEAANIFSMLNWIVDLTNKVIEAICVAIGLCPPATKLP